MNDERRTINDERERELIIDRKYRMLNLNFRVMKIGKYLMVAAASVMMFGCAKDDATSGIDGFFCWKLIESCCSDELNMMHHILLM